ncbi:MAG: oxygenase MpaB family protein [Acidimicrobiales bacterium]
MLRRRLLSGVALVPAGANVIMQLSRLPIGHAVAHSAVESGALTKHPVKRTRTSLGYILIALFGTEQERGVFRSQVNAQHRRANEGRDGVIDFNTFDAELQLWVAACMHRGIIDAVTFLHGPPNEADQGDLLIMSSRFATTLQVPNDKWPQTIGEFDVYWHESLALVVFNDDTRAYLLGIASLRFLPFPLDRIFGPSHRFLTAGFLPPLIRDQLGLAWSPRRQRRFERVTKGLRVLNHLLPRPLREFPWNVIERDTRRRIRRHHSIV